MISNIVSLNYNMAIFQKIKIGDWKYSVIFVDKAIKYFICKYLNPTY